MIQIIIIEDGYHHPWNDNLAGPGKKGEEFVLSRQSTLVLIQFKCCSGLHKLCYPAIRDRSTWSKFGAHGEHGDVFLFSKSHIEPQAYICWCLNKDIHCIFVEGRSRTIFFPSKTLIYGISLDGSKNFNIHTCEHMILGQLRIRARQAKNAPLVKATLIWGQRDYFSIIYVHISYV